MPRVIHAPECMKLARSEATHLAGSFTARIKASRGRSSTGREWSDDRIPEYGVLQGSLAAEKGCTATSTVKGTFSAPADQAGCSQSIQLLA
jgi:hypothetical protein